MVENKNIKSESWIEYIDSFINGHRGEIITLEVKDEGILANELPLQHFVLDPVDKGDALTIALGHKGVEFTHVVNSPIKITEFFNPKNGQVVSIEITDKNYSLITLSFKN